MHPALLALRSWIRTSGLRDQAVGWPGVTSLRETEGPIGNHIWFIHNIYIYNIYIYNYIYIWFVYFVLICSCLGWILWFWYPLISYMGTAEKTEESSNPIQNRLSHHSISLICRSPLQSPPGSLPSQGPDIKAKICYSRSFTIFHDHSKFGFMMPAGMEFTAKKMRLVWLPRIPFPAWLPLCTPPLGCGLMILIWFILIHWFWTSEFYRNSPWQKKSKGRPASWFVPEWPRARDERIHSPKHRKQS